MVVMVSNLTFSFQGIELAEQLKKAFDDKLTGYWQIKLFKEKNTTSVRTWCITVVQGLVVFSGKEKLSWKSFAETLQQLMPKLRTAQAKQTLLQFEQEQLLSRMLVEIQKTNLISYDEVISALRSKILSDLDVYLFNQVGEAEFIAEPELVLNAPIRGFDFMNLLSEAVKRQLEWKKLRQSLPSLSAKVFIKPESLETAQITDLEKEQLKNLVKDGRTLKEIAYLTGVDRLEVAKKFVTLIERGLIEIPSSIGKNQKNSDAEIFIVDDSPILLEQFRKLVQSWGYKVKYSSDALNAVEKILESNPTVIFLDINMPGASGFDLIKQIRRQPQLTSIPVVLLTAEKTIANQWRAQWASCKFLSKPTTREEIPIFQEELRNMLEQIVPITKEIHV